MQSEPEAVTVSVPFINFFSSTNDTAIKITLKTTTKTSDRKVRYGPITAAVTANRGFASLSSVVYTNPLDRKPHDGGKTWK